MKTKEPVYQNFINGRWQNAASEDYTEIINPANENETVGFVQRSTKQDVHQAVEAAQQAKKEWRNLSAQERGAYLYRVANIMESRLDEIAETATREMGKTLPETIGETKRAIAIFNYYAGEGWRKTGDVIPATDRKAVMYTERVPLGVVGIITPWNFPIAIPAWKMAPALVYGNCVVFKPAREGSLTAAKIFQCFADAGLPAGVANLVTGDGGVVGQAILDHPNVTGLTFTGSNETGKRVAQDAVARGAKYQLEMGGKNPLIVCADADLDEAVAAAVSGGLRTTGQKCTATSRIIVQEDIYDEFRQRLLEEIEKITVGNGLDEGVWMGPCVSKAQMEKVLSYIEKGKQEGARLIAGGRRMEEGNLANGFFIEPTVFENVTGEMVLAQEEIFGPVLCLMKVGTLNEALEVANDVRYGLSASIFTKNTENAFRFIDGIEAGLVRVNFETAGVELQAPFGGMKASSFGPREQGEAAKEFFTSLKTVYIRP